MQADNLVKLMKDQSDNLNDLIINLKNIQKFTVTNDLENLEEQIEREEKILHHVKLKEEERTKAIKELIQRENMDCQLDDALDIISEKLGEVNTSLYDQFQLQRKALMENVGQVIYLNSQNSILINYSRKFLKGLMKNLLDPKKENFLDKKV